MSVRLIPGDCLVELPKLAVAGERFHCCVTDPPYGLEFMGREWDGADGFRRSLNEADAGRDSVFGRTSRHAPEFRAPPVFQQWCEAWARAVYDVLLPGAFLLAFGGTRTYHRMVCAVEDAGFEIRDSIGWLFGSGFPKSHDVSKAIDRAAGKNGERVPVGGEVRRIRPGADQHADGTWEKLGDRTYQPHEYQPATDEAVAWSGWGTALKPAMELICVARKPLTGTVAENALAHGCGGLNIDASRVALADDDWMQGGLRGDYKRLDTGATEGKWGFKRVDRPAGVGRWPANIVHDGSEEVLAAFAAFGPAPGQQRKSSDGERSRLNCYGATSDAGKTYEPRNDSGTAARFFYTAKADKADRADSKHPTVKPIDLMRWLVTLVCPPGGRLLDPFAGSGTTGEACMLARFDCTLIERDPQHVADIRHRIKRWSGLDQPLFAEPAA